MVFKNFYDRKPCMYCAQKEFTIRRPENAGHQGQKKSCGFVLFSLHILYPVYLF